MRKQEIFCQRAAGQIKGGKMHLGNALQRWLNSHGLLGIALGVLGVAIALSLLLVVGGYYLVTP